MSWRYSNITEVEESGWRQFERLFCSGDDDECLFFWTPHTLRFLEWWINSTIDNENFYQMYSTQSNGPGNDTTLFFQRVADKMSAILQTIANPDIINITDVACGTEIYVQVRRIWLTLPLAILA